MHDAHRLLRGPQLRDRHLDEPALRGLEAQGVEGPLHLPVVDVGARRGLRAQFAQIARAHVVGGREPAVGHEDREPLGGAAPHVEQHEVLEPVLLVAGRHLGDDDRLDLLVGRLQRDGQRAARRGVPLEGVRRARAGNVGRLTLESRRGQRLPAGGRRGLGIDVGEREEDQLAPIGLRALEPEARHGEALAHAAESALEAHRERPGPPRRDPPSGRTGAARRRSPRVHHVSMPRTLDRTHLVDPREREHQLADRGALDVHRHVEHRRAPDRRRTSPARGASTSRRAAARSTRDRQRGGPRGEAPGAEHATRRRRVRTRRARSVAPCGSRPAAASASSLSDASALTIDEPALAGGVDHRQLGQRLAALRTTPMRGTSGRAPRPDRPRARRRRAAIVPPPSPSA